MSKPLTTEQLVKAAQFLTGIANSAEQDGRNVVALPTPTVKRLADALLEAVNREAA
jgi:hypothetical protein